MTTAFTIVFVTIISTLVQRYPLWNAQTGTADSRYGEKVKADQESHRCREVDEAVHPVDQPHRVGGIGGSIAEWAAPNAGLPSHSSPSPKVKKSLHDEEMVETSIDGPKNTSSVRTKEV
ncbi:hypothetical protein AYL99_11998 [Fonsecaea erecta]|uniref:Uncharacterized protein n=1 Tax=Fonsecaea erecta TaxID=1367422 RepID=A0A178Z1X7_9EURO|nr:hypothetical protein AYL99_11998 [Fonsecaea erecta]OAP53812.1 hypothetical protein AYL99_11998 [Fonsecaea erecta]